MKTLLLDPHGDDAALFAAYLCLKHKPLVVVTHRAVPRHEIATAMGALGCQWIESAFADLEPFDADHIIAPAWERDGLLEHNLVADSVVADISYLTYAGYPRRKSRGTEAPFEREWIWPKLRALAAFESQASTPSWFHFLEDLREYVL